MCMYRCVCVCVCVCVCADICVYIYLAMTSSVEEHGLNYDQSELSHSSSLPHHELYDFGLVNFPLWTSLWLTQKA